MVVYGRVAVRKKSCTAVGRAWSGHLGDRGDRVDLIGSGESGLKFGLVIIIPVILGSFRFDSCLKRDSL